MALSFYFSKRDLKVGIFGKAVNLGVEPWNKDICNEAPDNTR